MTVTIFLAGGGHLSIQDFDADAALDLRSELSSEHPLPFLTFDMDGATVLVNRDHIVRIDFETGA